MARGSHRRSTGVNEGAELRPLVSDLGHVAGLPGVRAAQTQVIADAVADLLDRS